MSKQIPEENIIYLLKASDDGKTLWLNAGRAHQELPGGSVPVALVMEVIEGKRKYCFVTKTRAKSFASPPSAPQQARAQFRPTPRSAPRTSSAKR